MLVRPMTAVDHAPSAHYPPAMQVDSGGVMLDVEVHGEASAGRSPVLLIHGFPDTKRLWTNRSGRSSTPATR